MLWDWFKREEVTCVWEEEVTAVALKYLVKLYTDVVSQTLCCVLILYRSFTHPNPPGRVVLDVYTSFSITFF